MSYQVKKHKRLQEKLELLNYDGKIAHTLNIELDADVMATQISKKYIALVHAQKNLALAQQNASEEGTNKVLEVIGETVVDLFETVFGEENTKIVVDFYENRYIEMCQEVLPFVVNVIIPKVREMAQESKANMLKGYSRKQKRAFGRK
jgi:tRNA U54 and U55 pseudouridine synthase Pus10